MRSRPAHAIRSVTKGDRTLSCYQLIENNGTAPEPQDTAATREVKSAGQRQVPNSTLITDINL